MIHQQRTPLQRFLSSIQAALLVACLLAVLVSAKPITSGKNPDTLLQLPSNNALAPKSTENKREIENAAASPSPLSPEHERVRQLWNKAKKLQHQLKPRRYVRNVQRNERQVIDSATNHTNVPKYIRELYRNLTECNNGSGLQQGTQANTVRSLPTVNNDANSKCDVFNFSLSSINSSEYVVKAELRFSLVRGDTSLSNVFVIISSLNESDSSSSVILSNSIDVENDQQKYTFDIAGKLLPWIQDGASYAELKVQFFENYKKTDTPLGCNRIHFYNQNIDEDREPLLVVHSYDSDLDQFDYASIIDIVLQNKTAERRRRSTEDAPNEQHRVPRQSQEVPYCQVIPLIIKGHEVPRKSGSETIVAPENYNAGICGGDCGSTMPQYKNLGHNVLLHMLQGSQEFRDRHGHHITRCCAPIKYAPLEVIVDVEQSVYIRIIPNMKITMCECLEIVDFSRTTEK